MIKAIIFDFGGVFSGAVSFRQVLSKISERLNKDVEDLYPFLRERWMACSGGEKDSSYFFEGCSREFQMPKFKQFWYDSFKVVPGTIELVNKLKGKIKLYIMSNNIKEWFEREWAATGIDYFDGIFTSYETGFIKPNLEFYEYVQKKIGLKSEELLFIDDKRRNLEPAKKIGWDVILFQNPKQLERELKERKVI